MALIQANNIFEFDDYLQRLEDGMHENAVPNIPRRYFRDQDDPLLFYTDTQFKKRYRFEKETVRAMMHVMHLNERLHRPVNRGRPISPVFQLLLALRFYATGSFQTILGDIGKVHQSTVSRIINRVTETLAAQMGNFVNFPSAAGMAENQRRFFQERGFPGVAGLIDCTHIPIQNPGGPFAELYRNRKRTFSVNVQIVCGPRREIFDIVARWPGSTHDARIFDNSRIKTRFQRRELPGCLVGDSGYPLLPYLLTPLHTPHNGAEERYNVAHKRVRNIVECCNGELKRRLLCLKKGLAYRPEKVHRIICACAILHNIAVKQGDPVPLDDGPEQHIPVQPVIQPQNGPAAAFRRAFIMQHFQ